jgi:hypothetical protein
VACFIFVVVCLLLTKPFTSLLISLAFLQSQAVFFHIETFHKFFRHFIFLQKVSLCAHKFGHPYSFCLFWQ